MLADVDEAVALLREAVQATPTDHPDRGMLLSHLSGALRIRFGRIGALADLDEAITAGREAAQATPADHVDYAMCRYNLSAALKARFERTGTRADLDEAIVAGRETVQATPTDHPDREGYLSDLGSALWVRFERVGAQIDLDEAVTVVREAVQATPADHPNRPGRLANLGTVLELRFGRAGALADLDEAIAAGREAVQTIPADQPSRAMYLSNLGIALRFRFERVGALADLDEAVGVVREAVQATPADHPHRAMYLSNLGGALFTRFERVAELADLDEAVAVGREAVQATPVDHPGRAGFLANLASALLGQFKRAGVLTDLDESIALDRQAVQATPTDHPYRATHLSNLGIALRIRCEKAGALADLDEAVAVSREAMETTPADHPLQAMYLFNLGIALQARFIRVGALADLDEAATVYAQTAEAALGAPSVRIRAAREAASLVAQADTKRAADLLEAAVRLLPETVVSRRLGRDDQQLTLEEFAGLASDAAALVLATEANPSGENPATRALRLLELGRGIMLSQALDTRSDFTDLQTHCPALATRFIELRDQLDQAGDISSVARVADLAATGGQRWVEDRQQLAIAFEAVVSEIRNMDGFETFLLPPEPDQLIHHAEHGPVVVVNVSQYRSDAIVLRSDGITAIPLPDLAQDALLDRIRSFHQALATAHNPHASSDQRRGAQDTLSTALEWLWDVAAGPILDELTYRHTPATGTVWPQLWWIPGGLLSFLPLHAAGYHREPRGPEGRRTVMDRVIPSYTPIVRALGYARERNATPVAAEQVLIVAMPNTPGLDSPLRHVAKEAEVVHARFPGSTLLIEDPAATESHTPSKANVLTILDNCAIAHFACHGGSHPANPSQSRLFLHDHDTDPFTVASLMPIRLERARLAYLSACRTAYSRFIDLADEAIHLMTAFQLAGYPHVVGTLWEIDDVLAVHVADTFYTALTTSDGTVDTRGAAQALHHAVLAIRDHLPTTPSLWAAYLHAGA